MRALILFTLLTTLITQEIICSLVEKEGETGRNNQVLEDVDDKILETKQDSPKPDDKSPDDKSEYGSYGHSGGGNPCNGCPPAQQCTNGYNQILSAGLNENYAEESDKDLLSQLEFLLKCSECMNYQNGQCYNGGPKPEMGPGMGPGHGGSYPEWGGMGPGSGGGPYPEHGGGMGPGHGGGGGYPEWPGLGSGGYLGQAKAPGNGMGPGMGYPGVGRPQGWSQWDKLKEENSAENVKKEVPETL